MTEVERFEHRGFEGRIRFQPRVSGVLDGICVIYKDGAAVDSISLDPMIMNRQEAIGMLRRAGLAHIEELASRQQE